MPTLITPGRLLAAKLFDVQPFDELAVESAFLSFTDRLGRPVHLYAARCFPLGHGPFPAVLHLVGGGQTVDPRDLAWWARHGYAAVSFDWQIGEYPKHDPARKTRWPAGVVHQLTAITDQAHAVIPLAIESAGVAIDWMTQDPRINPHALAVAGISWGGYLTWLVNGHESRLKAAIPVFGNVGIFDPMLQPSPKIEGPLKRLWQREWDPEGLVSNQLSPVCVLSSSNDLFAMHGRMHRLVDRLRVPHRRSVFPHHNHHLGPGEAALALAWLDHHLRGGPALPDEPVLMDDFTVLADHPHQVADTQVFWSPCAGGAWERGEMDTLRCWIEGPPEQVQDVRQAWGRVTYRNGVTLTTPLRDYVPSARPRTIASQDWPVGTDALGCWWDMSTTQFFGEWPALTISPDPDDRRRSLWRIARPDEGPLSILFYGLADPRWNHGDFNALVIQMRCPQPPTGLRAQLDLVLDDGRHIVITRDAAATRPHDATNPDEPWRVTLDRTGWNPAWPAEATWRHATRLWLAGRLPGNAITLGPISKSP